MKKISVCLLMLSLVFVFKAQASPVEDSLKQYTGKYKFPEGSEVTEVTVSLDSGRLNASSAQGSSELRKLEGDVFEVVAYGGTATFKRGADNKIIGIHLVVGDLDIEGTKTEESSLVLNTRRKKVVINNSF